MKLPLKPVIASGFVATSALLLVAANESLPGPVPARVLEVIDGDTIRVRARIWLGQELETSVRLAGVDAPELKGRCPRERELAQTAKSYIVTQVAGQEVRLFDVHLDKYGGRVIARVETPRGENLSSGLIAAGLARRYAGEARAPWCSV